MAASRVRHAPRLRDFARDPRIPLMLALGFGVAKIGRLERRQAVTVAIETAMQNATLAIVIGSTVLQDDSLVVPAAIYGVLMYVGGLACLCRAPVR